MQEEEFRMGESKDDNPKESIGNVENIILTGWKAPRRVNYGRLIEACSL